VIVVDDGSTDDTARVLHPFLSRICLISLPDNRGLSAARNAGLARAKGELIAFLDADDIWLAEKLEKQVACLAENPQVRLVHSDVIYWNALTGHRSREDRGRGEFVGSCYQRFFWKNRVLPSTVLVWGKSLAKVGGFDERFRRGNVPPGAEDYDLWLRIARHHQIAYVDEALVLYRHHSSNMTNNVLAMSESELYVIKKALRDDPEWKDVIGPKRIRERLFNILFGIGYHHHHAFRRSEARRYFLESLQYRPVALYVWLLYLANVLPAPWLRRLRGLKSSIPSFIGPGRAGAVECSSVRSSSPGN